MSGAPARAAAQAAARAADIVASVNPSFRDTWILLPHFQFAVAQESSAAVLRALTINPVTFAGTLRLEGIAPGSRERERRPFADSVRFRADGSVQVLIADPASLAPIRVEPVGSRSEPAGRLVVRAARWPVNRLFLVTVQPADLYEHRWRSVGFGVRDRIRVDDRRGIVFLADTSVANTVVAIGVTAGTFGLARVEPFELVTERPVEGGIVHDRWRLNQVVFAVLPDRDPQGNARAEIVLARGSSEEDAARALARAALEPADGGGGTPVPVAAVPPAPPRVVTPSTWANLLFAHLLGAARPMLDYDRIAGLRHTPAGSYTFLAAFDRDGWYGAMAALAWGDADAVCSEYRLFARFGEASGAQRHEIWNRLGAGGIRIWTDEWGGRWMGDKDPYQILKGYACYRATRDPAWLAAELPALRRIASYVLATDGDGDGLVEGMSYATYSEMSPLSPTDEPYATEDPYLNALAAYALERLGELEDAAAGGEAGGAAAWRAAAARIRRALPALWRPAMGWFAYHATPDGTRSWDHYHMQAVDALVWDGVSDTTIARRMVERLSGEEWWDEPNRGFYSVPPTDTWYDREGYWTGWGWHILDFKALHAALAYGAPEERRTAWQRLDRETQRIIQANYGRPGERGDNNGLFMFSAGAYLDLLARGLFGVEERLSQLVIGPRVDGLADDFLWRLSGWRVHGDSLSIAYRPVERAVTLELGAPHPWRLVLRFPWLGAESCVLARRGPAGAEVEERLALFMMADGSAGLLVRGSPYPATIRISGAACPDG